MCYGNGVIGGKAGEHLVGTEAEIRERQVAGILRQQPFWAPVLERLIHHLQQICRPLSK